MAVQYGATVRSPSASKRISSTDPQQQALLDAMNQNGVPDESDTTVDNSPTRMYSNPQAGGSNSTTMPVPTNQTSPPTQATVSGGVNSTGGLAPLGQYAGQMSGFDAGKLNSDHSSPKYQFAHVASQYDPRQGLQPGMLDQLNTLGIGQFSGSGDKLHIANGSPDFNGISDFDVDQGFGTGNGQWAWQPQDGSAQQQSAAPSAASPQGGGDPMTAITQLQTAASAGDSYSALVMKYLMQQLGLDQGMLANSQ